MFLNQLSHQEKKMFLDLSIHVAKANNELSFEEKAMISQYCNEMQLPAIELYETEPFGTISDYFSLADVKIKKIVILEILGLAYADGEYDDAELELIKNFVKTVGISEEEYTILHNAVIEYYEVCHKLAATIQ